MNAKTNTAAKIAAEILADGFTLDHAEVQAIANLMDAVRDLYELYVAQGCNNREAAQTVRGWFEESMCRR